MKIFLSGLTETIANLKMQSEELQKRKAEFREKRRVERQCAASFAVSRRCRAWSVFGDPDNLCIRHGGAKTAAMPKAERYPACRCAAYQFPHRHGSGLCNYPEEPFGNHPTPQGQRRYYKRQRKAQRKRWLKSLGL